MACRGHSRSIILRSLESRRSEVICTRNDKKTRFCDSGVLKNVLKFQIFCPENKNFMCPGLLKSSNQLSKSEVQLCHLQVCHWLFLAGRATKFQTRSLELVQFKQLNIMKLVLACHRLDGNWIFHTMDYWSRCFRHLWRENSGQKPPKIELLLFERTNNKINKLK